MAFGSWNPDIYMKILCALGQAINSSWVSAFSNEVGTTVSPQEAKVEHMYCNTQKEAVVEHMYYNT